MQLVNHIFNYDDWRDSSMIFNAVDTTNQVQLIEDITDGIVGNKSIDYAQAVEELADRLASVYAALITDYFPKDKLDEDMEKDCERVESVVNALLMQVAQQLTNAENGYRDDDSRLMCPLPTNDTTLSREERFKTNKDNIYENFRSSFLVMYIDSLKTPHDVIDELDLHQMVWINNNIFDIANAYYEPEKASNSARLGGIGSMNKSTRANRRCARRNKTSRFGVWQWDDWARDIPTLICDSIDNHGVFFAELIPSWPNDRGEYEWDGSFDPETEPTNWTLEIYDTEFGEEDWTEVYGTAREAMEEADDFIAKFITEQNLIGNGPYTLARRNAMRKRRNKTAKITWGEASDILEACVDKAVEYFEDMVSDGEDVDDSVSEAVYGAIDDTCMYYTDQLAMIWACGALEDAFMAASEKISDEVYAEFYQKIDPEDYRKEGRRKAMRRKMRR